MVRENNLVGKAFGQFMALALVGLGFLLVHTTLAFAQADVGVVSGTVKDQMGAAIPGSKVTLTNQGTNIARSTTTDTRGLYVFSPVRVGTYTVSVSKPGFTSVRQPNVVVNIQETSVVSFTLRPGELTQTVEVTGTPPVLQTSSGSVQQLVGSKEINDLPLNGRNYTFLAHLVAGVTQMQNSGNRALSATGSFTANGTSFGQSNYMLNGIDNNNTQPGLVGGTTYAVLPPIDALQEFTVQTSNYSAEFGRAGGAVVNATLKSGTNKYHGDVYGFLRNDALDAADFFENAAGEKKTEFRQNQFGVTLGGPVSIPGVYHGKNKTFFFVDYEGTRIRQGVPSVWTVPTLGERSSGFTNLSDLITGQPGTTRSDLLGRAFPLGQVFDPATTRPVTAGQVDPVTGLVGTGTGYVRDSFPGNIIPSNRIDPNAVKLLDLFPLPTQSGLFDNYTTSPIMKKDSNDFDGRIDENISDRDQTFVTFDYNHTGLINPPPFPGLAEGGGQNTVSSQSYTALTTAWSETHTFSPTMINEFEVGFTRYNTFFGAFNANNFGIPEQFGIQGIPQVPGNGGLPPLDVGFYAELGVPTFLPTFKNSNVWDIRENLTRVQGSHTLKIGFEYQYNFTPFLIPTASRGSFQFNGLYTSIPGANQDTTGPAQFLLTPTMTTVPNGIDNVGGANSVLASNTVNTTEIRHYYGAYFQDDWKTTSKLMLNLGIRYEYFSPYLNRYGAQAMFVPGPPFAGAQYLYPVSRQNDPKLPAVFLDTLSKDGIALNLTDNVAGQSPAVNFGPRFGFAYSITPKLVIRGGYGIAFSGMGMDPGGDHLPTNSFPFLFNYSFTPPDPAHPITPDNSIGLLENGMLNIALTPSALKSGEGFTLVARQFNFPEPYTEATNLTLQYQLSPSQSIQAAYVGTFGRHLEINPGTNLVSQVLPTSVNVKSYLPYPDVAEGLPYVTYGASSYYHSLQMNYQRMFSGGLGILGNYTWSKCRTDARDELVNNIGGYRAPYLPGFGIQGDYSLCDFDVRNVVHVSGTYQLPFGSGKHFLSHASGLANAIVGGWVTNWILTLQDGMPVTIPCTISTAAEFGCNALLVPGQSPIGGPHNVDQWLNPKAFANPTPATAIGQTNYAPLGGAPTQVIGPGFHRLDFSLFKEIKTSESTRLEFRAEFFNITNTPNFSNNFSTNFASPVFGKITSTVDDPNDPREIQFALKFYW